MGTNEELIRVAGRLAAAREVAWWGAFVGIGTRLAVQREAEKVGAKPGAFFEALLGAWSRADRSNQMILAKGWPDYGPAMSLLLAVGIEGVIEYIARLSFDTETLTRSEAAARAARSEMRAV